MRNQNLLCLSVAVAPHSVIGWFNAAGEHHSAFGNHITPAIFMSLRHISYPMFFQWMVLKDHKCYSMFDLNSRPD